jgi:hypothetical protein
MKMKLLTALITLTALNAAFADKMIDSQKEIVNLTPTLTALKSQTDIPVVFPTQVPKHPTLKKLYAYIDPNSVKKDAYTISIDSSSTCKGAHYCEVGMLQVATKGEPKDYQDMENHNITTSVNLTPTQKASYTPGHALADYWSPILEWRDGAYFYSLTWQVKSEKALVTMAHSLKAI